MNIALTEADLFAIRSGLTYALLDPNVKYMLVCMDMLHAAKKIFDFMNHPFQSLIITITHLLFSNDIQRIRLSSENAQVQTNGVITITMWAKKRRSLRYPISLAEHHETSVGLTTLLNGKCVIKHPSSKEINSLYSKTPMRLTIALKAHGLNMIYILTRYCLHLSLSFLFPFFSFSFSIVSHYHGL